MRVLRIIFASALLACPFVFAAYTDYWRFVRSLSALELRESGFSSLADTSFNFIYASDSSSRIAVSRYFNLDSLTSYSDGSSRARSLAIARFVGSNIPHDNQEGGRMTTPPSVYGSSPSRTRLALIAGFTHLFSTTCFSPQEWLTASRLASPEIPRTPGVM